MDAAPFLARILARNPFDPATFDPGAVRLAQVDAEERARDPAVPDRDAPRRHVNARGVAAEIAASPAVDVESLEDDAVGANAHDAPRARAREPRASVSDQMQRFVDDEIARVGAGPDFDHTAGLRGVDPRLKRRGLRGGRPALQSRGRGRRHLLAAERGEEQERGQNHPATTRVSAASPARASRHARYAAPATTRTAAMSA